MSWHEDAEYPVRDWREEVINDYLGKAHELDLAAQKLAEVIEMLPDDTVAQVIRAKLQTAQGHINTVRGRQ